MPVTTKTDLLKHIHKLPPDAAPASMVGVGAASGIILSPRPAGGVAEILRAQADPERVAREAAREVIRGNGSHLTSGERWALARATGSEEVA